MTSDPALLYMNNDTITISYGDLKALYQRGGDAKTYEYAIKLQVLPALDRDSALARLKFYRALRLKGHTRPEARSSAFLFAISCLAVKVRLQADTINDYVQNQYPWVPS